MSAWDRSALGWAELQMLQRPLRWDVDDFWRVPQQNDLTAVLHRLEVAPWYADHGVSVASPFPEVEALEVRSVKAAQKSRLLKHQEKARRLAIRAISEGRLVRPSACSKCRKTAVTDGHHADYSKPLEVEWLCRRCHSARHVQIRAAA